jgi:hypothetical protein
MLVEFLWPPLRHICSVYGLMVLRRSTKDTIGSIVRNGVMLGIFRFVSVSGYIIFTLDTLMFVFHTHHRGT